MFDSVLAVFQSSHSSSIETIVVLLGLAIFDFDFVAYLSARSPDGFGIG